MADVLTYKGFVGSVHFSADDSVFHGKIEGIGDLVTFEGASVEGLTAGFKEAVEDYLQLCKRTGKHVEKSYRGTFNVRVPPELHVRRRGSRPFGAFRSTNLCSGPSRQS